MKAKQRRKALSKELKKELRLNTKKTNPRRQATEEHQVFNELDNE